MQTACLALLLEALLGYPAWLYGRVRHPVVWIGTLIDTLERRLNRPAGTTRSRGALALALALALPTGLALLLGAGLRRLLPPRAARLVLALLASTLLAQRSLHHHVRDVGCALRAGGIGPARTSLARIVGRETAELDEPAVLRAAIESLAENFSDGVVAPALWCALLGLPGITLYKALNTADSMIGHRSPRLRQFGWAAARLDDLANLPAARLSALWLALAAGSRAPGILRIAIRHAPRHRSPNAGWPEAAMAAALGLRLGGPRRYADELVDDGWLGSGTPDARPADLDRALALYRRACVLQLAACAALAWWRHSGLAAHRAASSNASIARCASR